MTPAVLPNGFDYVADFLNEDERADALAFCRAHELAPFTYQGRDSNRRVKNFGVNFDYEAKRPYLDVPIPAAADALLARVAAHLGRPASELKELLITWYPPGAGINWHRDSRPFETVAAVSLGNAAKLQLRPVVAKGEPSPILNLTVGNGSLYVLDGDARTKWMHRVPPVTEERWSITIRSLRPEWDITNTGASH